MAYTLFFCRTATPAARDRFGGTARCCLALECAWAHSNRSATSFFLSSVGLYTGQVHTHTSATSASGSVRNTTQHVPDACLREESTCVSVMRATSRRGVVCLRCGCALAALAVKTAICACCLCSCLCVALACKACLACCFLSHWLQDQGELLDSTHPVLRRATALALRSPATSASTSHSTTTSKTTVLAFTSVLGSKPCLWSGVL
jgi:hypothetical protein